LTIENYSIPKNKSLLEEIIKIAEKETLFHAQIVGASGRLRAVKIIPTNFNTRSIEPEREFGIAKLEAVIKKTTAGYTAVPLKVTLFNCDNPKITIDGELRAATTASEIKFDISKHDLSKIIS